MALHSAPVFRSFEKDDEATDRFRPETRTIEHDLCGQAVLDAESAQRLLDGGQLRLDLHDQRDAIGRADRENVDRAAIAVVIERDLDIHIPAEPSQERGGRADETRVVLVEQSVDRAITPADDAVIPRLYRHEHRSDRREGESIEVATFDQRHRRLRDAHLARELGLGKPESQAEDPEDPAGADVVHSERIKEVASF